MMGSRVRVTQAAPAIHAFHAVSVVTENSFAISGTYAAAGANTGMRRACLATLGRVLSASSLWGQVRFPVFGAAMHCNWREGMSASRARCAILGSEWNLEQLLFLPRPIMWKVRKPREQMSC